MLKVANVKLQNHLLDSRQIRKLIGRYTFGSSVIGRSQVLHLSRALKKVGSR